MNELSGLKQEIYQHCLALVEAKAERLQADMDTLQAGANEDTKSSAGDKYETARAMAMIEKENLAKQLGEVLKQLQVLQQLQYDQTYQQGALGALVHTSDRKYYFLAVSLGPVKLNGKIFLVISPVSPIGQLLLGKIPGGEFQFNRKAVTIKGIA